MCIHEYYLSKACGHHFPKLPPSAEPDMFFENHRQTFAVPQSFTCIPVKLALKFYHDQVVYLPADMNHGAKVELPRKCPIVHSSRDGPTKRTLREDRNAWDILNNRMLMNGLGACQRAQVEVDAAKLDQCSNRTPQGDSNSRALRRHKEQPYPKNMFQHVLDVRAFQERNRTHMKPNVAYFDVDFGCGGPFSTKCLTGWSGRGLLTHRLHHWSDKATHPERCDQYCLTGWSGEDLDTYRQQTWLGRKAKDRGTVGHSKSAPRHNLNHHAYWVKVDYSNNMDLHADQWKWDGTRNESVRKANPPNGSEVVIPEQVLVPVPQRLYQALSEMCCMSVPGSPLPEEVERASIEDILGRLPEAFEEQDPLSRQVSRTSGHITGGYESASTLVDEPAVEPASVKEETSEMAEARRRKAREVLREKLRRDFSKGKGKMIDEEEKDTAEAATAEDDGSQIPKAAGEKEESEAKNNDSTNSPSLETPALPGSGSASLPTAGPTTSPVTDQKQGTTPLEIPTTSLATDQKQAPLATFHHPSSDVDESKSSPINNDVVDELYDTEEGC